eukprot:TRINITY_DN49384_c0_g1_i1.p1 TRINITY_DN49384_c0_g1~~TRINITY_DN49384_c0_g1_i1.p1  ORF type:complete len:459 (-),score=67.27 TRINITY_DN49384_c0_g1_i1:27-1403(-)
MEDGLQKIHAVFATVDMMGHLMPLVPFMKELHARGHQVTLFMPDKDKYAKRLQEFGLGAIEAVRVPLPDEAEIHKSGPRNIIKGGGPLSILSEPLFAAITTHYHQKAKLPSVVLVEFFATAAVDAADALGVPAIVVYPNPGGLVYLSNPSQRGCLQTMKAKLAVALEAVLARILLTIRNRERKRRGLPSMAEQDVYPCYNMKRPFISTWGLGYEYAFLQSPLLNYVGPTEPESYPPLSGDLALWVEQQSLPIVYVAFGTMHKFTPADCKCLLRQLESVTSSCAVLWSLPSAQQEMLDAGGSSSVRVESFVPQYAVLNHPNVHVFITHCGGNSVGEAVLTATPMVCCPGMADQPASAARIESAGAGIMAKGGVAGVGVALQSLLRQLSAYQQRVQKLKRLQLSHGGAKRAADVIESIADVGYEHMVPHRKRGSCFCGLAWWLVVFCAGGALGRATCSWI